MCTTERKKIESWVKAHWYQIFFFLGSDKIQRIRGNFKLVISIGRYRTKKTDRIEFERVLLYFFI